jgi:CRP/FNR family cyclic AMP-dependent transcriptional regulator
MLLAWLSQHTPLASLPSGLLRAYPAVLGANRGEVSWRTSELAAANKWPEVCSSFAVIASTVSNDVCDPTHTMKTDLPMREIRRRLSWVEFLSPLSEGEMVALLRNASFLRLEEGKELVVGPEEHAEWMLVVVAGQLQVNERSVGSGRELTLWVSGDGEAVCVTGLVPRWTRELHLRALEISLLCRVESQALEEAMRSNPEVGLRLARTLANRLQLMEDRWADMVEKEVSERLAGLIYMLVETVGVMTKEGPMIPTRYTHNQLASMVGSNREAVTRAMGHLQGEGAIEVRGRRVYVRDFHALRRHAGE